MRGNSRGGAAAVSVTSRVGLTCTSLAQGMMTSGCSLGHKLKVLEELWALDVPLIVSASSSQGFTGLPWIQVVEEPRLLSSAKAGSSSGLTTQLGPWSVRDRAWANSVVKPEALSSQSSGWRLLSVLLGHS